MPATMRKRNDKKKEKKQMKNSERFIGVSQSAEDYWRFVSFADFCPVLPLVLLSIHFFSFF